jgi:hypothetical protein
VEVSQPNSTPKLNMALSKDLKIENVVILANNFNPSIFSTHWLYTKEICKEGEISPVSGYAQNISQTITNEFQLLVLPDQLQFARLPALNGEFLNMAQPKLLRIISLLKEVPYKSSGLNFHWFVYDNKMSIAQLSKELFFISSSKLFNAFESKDSHYGAYLSKDFEGARLKLDIKPIKFNLPNQPPMDCIQFAFNYHKDLQKDREYEDLKHFLEKSKVYFEHASQTMKLI